MTPKYTIPIDTPVPGEIFAYKAYPCGRIDKSNSLEFFYDPPNQSNLAPTTSLYNQIYNLNAPILNVAMDCAQSTSPIFAPKTNPSQLTILDNISPNGFSLVGTLCTMDFEGATTPADFKSPGDNEQKIPNKRPHSQVNTETLISDSKSMFSVINCKIVVSIFQKKNLIYYILGSQRFQKAANVEMLSLSDLMSNMKTKLCLKDGLEFAQRLLNKIGFQNSPSQPSTPGIL